MNPPVKCAGEDHYSFGLPKEWHRIDDSLHRLAAMMCRNDLTVAQEAADELVESLWETIQARMIDFALDLETRERTVAA